MIKYNSFLIYINCVLDEQTDSRKKGGWFFPKLADALALLAPSQTNVCFPLTLCFKVQAFGE